ncbi:helix-turn-helix domain-containing protein [Brevibacillus dissolubilis]|uniref:helix-turn-helix domain-containing protein n=1 Tax=Brevibacillus dissolubilis TaxID=1844116 RepID=UPI0011178D47|nr:helix-turn-helix domain-containing protein [Brevibacillus dissolubilis]
MNGSYDPQRTRIELRHEFESDRKKRGWKRRDLAKATGIEPVTISNILNNKQSITLPQLDAITEAFNRPEGTYYETYMAECFSKEGKLLPARCAALITRCYQTGRQEIIDRLLELMSEETDPYRTNNMLFEIAEMLFHSDRKLESLPFFDKFLAWSTKKGEKSAVAHYRRYLIHRDRDLYMDGLEALHQLLEYLPYLPAYDVCTDPDGHKKTVPLKCEGYRQVVLYYHLVERWDKLLTYADEMAMAARLDNERGYLVEALHYKAVALREKGELEKAPSVKKRSVLRSGKIRGTPTKIDMT